MNSLALARSTSLRTNLLCSRPLSTSIRQLQQREARPDYVDVDQLLSQPTWSVSSLLPPKGQLQETGEVSSKQLHHLLRLSALPPPKDEQEEAEMLATLESQLHFVKEIQKVDTTGVEPFSSLRDETEAGEQEAELDLAAMKDALAQEEVRGNFHRRIRRVRDGKARQKPDWDVLGGAERKVGKFFVVEGGKDG